MKEIFVTAYPYATQYGTINVPESLSTREEIEQFVFDNFDAIDFGEPELDYAGTDLDIDWFEEQI